MKGRDRSKTPECYLIFTKDREVLQKEDIRSQRREKCCKIKGAKEGAPGGL